MKKALLHICCGICASHAIDTLRNDGYQVTGFFYNPNIAPEQEHAMRLQVVQEVAQLKEMPLRTAAYDPQRWDACVKGMEEEPEGGKRCSICFGMRLRQTLQEMDAGGFDHFVSTLSISPHKNTAEINRIGKELAAGKFLPYDFKRDDGFKKTMAFAKERRFYRQHYCGCIFSKRP
jgi:predicted adenine nucleotide alpha hydrolase (AANH) superfamily ATPase